MIRMLAFTCLPLCSALALRGMTAGAGQAAQQAPAPPQAVGEKGQPAARVDAFGDPLPPGARLRLGTTRFRHVGQVYCLAFTPDGNTLASGNDCRTVRLWETLPQSD